MEKDQEKDVKTNETGTGTTGQEPEQAATPQVGVEDKQSLDPAKLAEELERAWKEIKQLRSEAAKYRNKAKETAQEAEKAKTLEERLAELEKAYQETQHRAQLAEIKAQLIPALGNDSKRVEAALALAERDGLITDGGVELEQLFERYPFLKPQAQTPKDAGANPPGSRPISLDDLKKMSPEEINRNWDHIKAGWKRT